MIQGSKAPASRTLKVSAVALVSVLALAACGGGGNDAKIDAGTSGSDKTATNPQPVDKLDQGGTLQIPVGGIGPDYNRFSANGNSSDNANMQSPMYQATVFNYKADGSPVLNKDFMEDAKSEMKDGKQVITYTFNPKAKWNDGTPIDWKTLKNQAEVLSGKNKDYALVSSAGYEDIEKVEKGDKDNVAVVTMKKEFYPWEDLFSDGSGEGMFHPAINTPDIFNKGFNKLHPEWMAGPFKLEKNDSAAKTVSMVPNDKWWGEKPVLNKIIFRAIDSTANIAAFKNGEVDAVAISTEARYKQAAGAANAEERRGQRLSVFGLVFNAKSDSLVKDPVIRKAMWQATNREQMRDVRYKGLDWKEDAPGSWMSMPFSPYYENNYPVQTSVEESNKTLEAAGWKKGSDGIYAKDGKRLTVTLTDFGQGDPMTTALDQTIQAQMKNAGIELKLDVRGDSQFNDTMAKRNFQVIMMGYTVGSDPTSAPKQYYKSGGENMSGTGTAEIDKMIADFKMSDDASARAKQANAIEKKAMEQYGMLPMWNGPIISLYRKGLANYGPSLYQSIDWTKVGFEKGSTHK
ncbi:ABC transporter family substrate-binding protein [Falsarthrobacter nasiphocae]|uniref:Peptide/nickel transport system substrate-binding protein n=1 Tax=Falsarthrobacter nasiphocae TaxID=189863 RepID=A0AAE4C6S3_9MICC|nr:ABC transporter family substrate-binding protein [Falsarthrobacter nasiphocae]MDR6892462.1 peptide/nickel transport system substrate-binding protein [Falsarthrobacter nasiphocae]